MADTRGVTGGDLYSLWRVANITLPMVEKVYVDQANAAHEISAPDDQKFGRCHPWWAQICLELEQVLFITASTLGAAGNGLQRAVDEFSYVDGDTAGQITAAGTELQEILDDPNLHDKDDELEENEKPGNLQAPEWNVPDDWYSNPHND